MHYFKNGNNPLKSPQKENLKVKIKLCCMRYSHEIQSGDTVMRYSHEIQSGDTVMRYSHEIQSGDTVMR